MEDMLNVAEAKTRLIQELSEITGFKYLKSGVLKKTVKDIVFEINFFSSKWNESGQSIEINAELRLIYKTYGKLPVDNVVASMSYQPENGYWYDISTESRLLETRNILEKRFQETAMDLVHRFENNYHSAVQYLFFEGFEKYDVPFTVTRFIKLRYVDMRETIQNYFEKTKQYPNYYSNEDFSTICDGIKKEIDKGVFLVERKDETDLSVFEEKYGYRWRSGR